MNDQVRGPIEVPPGMTYQVLLALPLSLISQAWVWYEETFAEINRRAALRHLMTVDEFIQVMQDTRIEKHLVRGGRGGWIEGLGVCTSDLAAWPLISPEFFQARWPEHYEQHRIWFVGFIGSSGSPDVFRAILRGMQKGEPDDLWVMDVCQANLERIERAARFHLRGINKAMNTERVDAQTFLAMRFDGRR